MRETIENGVPHYIPEDKDTMTVAEYVDKCERNQMYFHRTYEGTYPCHREINLAKLKERHMGKTVRFEDEEWFSDSDNGYSYVSIVTVCYVEE